MIGCLRTRVRKQPIIALYFESENVLKLYNLEAMCHFLHHAHKAITFSSVMRGSRKLCQRGSNSDNVFFFFLMRGKRIQISLQAGHHRRLNGVSLAGRWWPNIECWLCSFVIFQGIQTSIAKKPYIFVIFQVEGSGPPAPSGSAHVSLHCIWRLRQNFGLQICWVRQHIICFLLSFPHMQSALKYRVLLQIIQLNAINCIRLKQHTS